MRHSPSWSCPYASARSPTSDDGLLGYFVEDDYSHFPRGRPGDRRAGRLPSGRGRGVLSDGGSVAPVPIDHPYVDPPRRAADAPRFRPSA